MTHAPTTTARVAAITDAGLVRSANEDAFLVADLSTGRRLDPRRVAEWQTRPAGVLLAVSDGVGGAAAGEVASALSVEAVFERMVEAARCAPPRSAPDGETLRHAVEAANRRVHEASHRPGRHGMGATLTAILLVGTTAYVAQIGDSRAYLVRRGEFHQVTRDQSYVQMLVDAGILTEGQAATSPAKNIVMQAMGQEAVQVVLGRFELARGDRLLVCSDGLTNVVANDVLLASARPPADVARACVDLVRRTRDGGAPDNVTVVLADVA